MTSVALSQCPGIDQTGKDSTAAIQAALNLKQPIVWDCVTTQVAGQDATKSVFVPDGTDITFPPQGRLDTDATGFPALCAMHASATIRGLKVRYTGTPSLVQPVAASTWTNGPARNYLLANGLNPSFVGVGGTQWTGPGNTSSLISIRGASNVQLLGGKVYVDDDATADKFVTVAFAFDAAFAVGIPCVPGAPLVTPNVTVTGFELDGTCMGFVGGGSNVVMTKIIRRRYADLQDAQGNVTGGVTGSTWMPPPHWIYLQGSVANPFRIAIKDAVDLADWRGSQRRAKNSGFINSVKVEIANGSTIDGLYSRCADGGLAVLANGSLVGGEVKNARFVIDTSIVDINGNPCGTGGVFFPSGGVYPSIKMDDNISICNAASGCPLGTIPPAVKLVVAMQSCM